MEIPKRSLIQLFGRDYLSSNVIRKFTNNLRTFFSELPTTERKKVIFAGKNREILMHDISLGSVNWIFLKLKLLGVMTHDMSDSSLTFSDEFLDILLNRWDYFKTFVGENE